MSKLIAVIVVAVAIVGGAYWISGKAKPAAMAPTTSENNTNETPLLPGEPVAKGPFMVMSNASGQYLADKAGMALYVNLKDVGANGQITASCNAACEKNWPPYLLGTEEAAPDKSSDPLLSKLNLFKRADGRYQYALGSQPLYYYVGDRNTLDTLGASIPNWALARP